MAEKSVTREFYFTSSFRGKGRRMSGRLWQPAPETRITEDGEFYYTQAEPRALIQILHGMQEHCGRYDELGRFLAGAGFLVLAHDHAGHGGSMEPENIPGYFDDFKGWDRLVEDALELKRGVAPSYPGCPVYLFGHSMGSFVARTIAARYGGDYDGFIFCGTAGKNSMLPLARQTAKFICSTGGRKKPSPLLRKLAFGSYNERFKEPSEFAWLSRDPKTVADYESDPLCGIPFTAGGFKDIFDGLSFLQSPEWPGMVPDKPVLLLAGEEDPVGGYGKGVEEVAELLKGSGHSQVTCRIYPGMRHEVLNEVGREEVQLDIFHWLEECLRQSGKETEAPGTDSGAEPAPMNADELLGALARAVAADLAESPAALEGETKEKASAAGPANVPKAAAEPEKTPAKSAGPATFSGEGADEKETEKGSPEPGSGPEREPRSQAAKIKTLPKEELAAEGPVITDALWAAVAAAAKSAEKKSAAADELFNVGIGLSGPGEEEE